MNKLFVKEGTKPGLIGVNSSNLGNFIDSSWVMQECFPNPKPQFPPYPDAVAYPTKEQIKEAWESIVKEDGGVKTAKAAPKPDQAHTFLDEAVTTMKQRATLRDKVETGERSMACIVDTFNALTGHELTEAEGWEFMILLKMVRGRQGSYNKDDYVDMGAYSGLLGECESSNPTRRK